MIKRGLPSILLIVGWSLLVHLPGITSPLLDYHAYRQCQTASMAQNYVRHGMHFLSPELDTSGLPVRAGTEFPLYSYLLAILFRLFGSHDILGRLLSCFFAAWGAVFLYLFVRPRLGETIGFWSAIVMCSIPVHIYFTRSVQPEPMALWGLLGFLYYADVWLRDEANGAAWALALFLGSLAPLLKLPFLYVLAPLWFYLGYERWGLALVKKPGWVSLLGFILLFTEAWYHYAKTAPVGILPLSIHEHLANLAPILTWNLWRAQFISRVPEIVTTYSGLLFAGFGFARFRKEKSFSFFLFWIPVSILYVGLLGEYGLIHRYTLLPLTPLSAVGIACGISVLWQKAQSSAALRAGVIVLIIGIPLHAALRIKHWYRVEYPYVGDARDFLSRESGPDDLILIATHETPVVLYYVDRYGYAVDPAAWTIQQVDDILARGVRFVFIPLEENPDRLAEWKSVLSARGTLIREHPGYLLYRMVGSTSRLRQE